MDKIHYHNVVTPKKIMIGGCKWLSNSLEISKMDIKLSNNG